MSPFQEIVVTETRKAHKASSSSSPSSSSKRWKYDVFLSFRGEDTRKGFTGHLHAALSDAGISTFLDDNELERAEFIKTQLEQAIDKSMISIIVFSKSYADSSWCLDELVKIMECRGRLRQQVIPLFYNVDASDVRKQTGSFAQAFEKHEAGICEGKHEKEKVQRWRNALTQAADLCGEDLKNADNGHEAKFIKKILGEVNKQLYRKYQLDIEQIVITTRNQHLLEQVGVDGIYMAQEMDEKEALELLSRHAFESGYPNQEYLDLSKRVIRYCRGLPLALEVVGSFLIKRSIAEWENHLEKLKRSPDGDIQKILRISFDGLPDDTTRKIFLDISCFFIGDDKDYVTKILDGCGFFATIGISVLIDRCLVTVGKYNKLRMHDLLRDMGREIVYENAHGHPEKLSRLWKREDVTNVLCDESGTDEIEGVALDMQWSDEARFRAQAFTNMKKLRLLRLSNVELTGEYKDFPKKLIWLSWHEFPLRSIPDDFPMQPKLVSLDLRHSKLRRVWKDCKLHQNLKILNLSCSCWLRKSPDVSKLPNLEELILEYCWRLSEVHSSIGDLGRLSLVNLEGCDNLEDLPLNFYKSKSIETLLLNGCSSFKDLADGLGDMVSLTILEADNTAISQIPSSIVKLKKLRILSLSGCRLTVDAIPKDLCSLISLEHLLLGYNGFCGLPSLAGLSKLKVLCLNACRRLRAIPDLPTNLYVLKAYDCPELETISDFSKMSNIRELYLSDSFKLTEVPGLDKSLNSMTRIHMEGCTNLTADFRNNILQGWTSCGYGGIFLSGNDIPDWFDCVHDDDIVYFTVPQSVGRNLKGLTLSFGFSSSSERISLGFHISIKNMTKGTELEARIIPDCRTKGYYLWQGQLSNDELKLQDGDKVLIEIIIVDKWVKVKKTGVSLVWDKFMNENMIDYHLCAYERRPYLVNDDDIIHVKYDYDIRKSPDFSKFPNLEKLILKGCTWLYKVHSSIGDLGRLSLVNLEGCTYLDDLPLNFYKSKSIETLLLNGCRSFENLADGLGDMV
ncbi:PREDICTED: TMV resistance protein N-like [Prunus mume]|uniref:TMV resistance protein N-like n=1 Tax=Prunus mume TaxID=102107 RepID=A0ABM1LHP7_PRUMU|nr:PREDICTED: TMV resistance protein N-like [Prunus mume]